MSPANTEPRITPPLQAPPVYRNIHEAPQAQHPDSGVEAARTRCADLPDPARQQCYAQLYGIST
ncbi:hypothetical protein ACF08B_40765 [Streptomyces sp. NPDC015139]|uniref:hypothetical protein n=1 Tax=Streptomyces sp. NPDC015139 TaxID=3364942 RepID=UPI0037031D57